MFYGAYVIKFYDKDSLTLPANKLIAAYFDKRLNKFFHTKSYNLVSSAKVEAFLFVVA